METRLRFEDDLDSRDDRIIFNDTLLEHAVEFLSPAAPTVREVIVAILRVGTLAMVVSIVTGLYELGLVIAIAGTFWLYYLTCPFRLGR